MASLASNFLAELSDVGIFLQGLPNIRSPVVVDASDSAMNFKIERPSSAASSVRSGSVSRQNTPSLEASLNEKGKSRGKGRVLKAVGDLYLLSGRTMDALSKYLDALEILRINTDHLWHASCLESIGICYFQLAQFGIDFQVSTQLFPSYIYVPQSVTSTPPPTRDTSAHHTFPEVLLELHEFIHTLYSRTTSYGNEIVPPLCQADFLQRSLSLNCILLGSIDMANVIGSPPRDIRLKFSRQVKKQLMSYAMRLYDPSLFNQLSLKTQIEVLWELSQICATLEYQRKERFFLHEVLTVLTPNMVQARVNDAADKGLHPSTGFLLSETDRDDPRTLIHGIYDLMEQVCEKYDVTEEALARRVYDTLRSSTRDWISLKIIVLRDCILLSESIPDIHAIVSFHMRLLRLARAHMSNDDQNRIKNGLIRAVNLGKRVGRPAVEGLYWDPYLLQTIIANSSDTSKLFTKHTSSEIAEVAISDPFIYNPFAKSTPQNDIPILPQHEAFEVTVSLRNPYAFETEIESIRLIAEGIAFEAPPASTVIPANSSSHYVRLRIIPTSSGLCRITGCSIKVWACREQQFMFLEYEGGRKSTEEPRFNASHRLSSHAEKDGKLQVLVTFVEAIVIPAQPFLTMDLEGLPKTLLLLEGEYRTISAILANESDTAATMVIFTLQDSVSQQFHDYQSQRLNEIDLFYLESYLHKNQAFALKEPHEKVEVSPHSNRVVDVITFGKRGLSGGTFQVDYGKVAARAPTAPIYTRQASVDLAITVHPSIKISIASILPLDHFCGKGNSDSVANEASPFWEYLKTKSDPSLYCLALMDVHNYWSQSIDVNLQYKNDGKHMT